MKPTTIALSPASVMSIRMTWRRAMKGCSGTIILHRTGTPALDSPDGAAIAEGEILHRIKATDITSDPLSYQERGLAPFGCGRMA
ncbi:MAG TPA: hypothetical protein VMA30_21660 [Xanthobacteraceae bacterium]|nr:hypothetical protein [Xanthobacteraceae bacterium]